jgi:kumamolisin
MKILSAVVIATALLGRVAFASMSPADADMGPSSTSSVQTVTLFLRLNNRPVLEHFVEDVTNPLNANFHQWLTPDSFTALYSPSAANVASIVSQLQARGITVLSVAPNRLAIQASGTVSALNGLFSMHLHEYSSRRGRYRAPDHSARIPASLSDSVLAVAGLSSQHIFRSHLASIARKEGVDAAATSFAAAGTPGSLTVLDVARMYQLNPLYNAGFKGQGRTVGIATLASFDPNDAYGYWTNIGLPTKPNRITQVHVDGGGGTTAADGTDETTLDVEQSGGLAPRADIIVYDAPNTDQGFLDVFVKAVNDNKVETLSVSWGAAEIATDPTLASAQDQLFLQAAAQGMSLFAASGDAGAFDINDEIAGCVNTLTVDSPASSPYITAAGGLTLAGTQTHKFPTPVVTVPADRPWGWNYLADYFNTNYADMGGYYGIAFPVGGGGGVSVVEPLPNYQKKTDGIRTSQPSQSLICAVPNPDGTTTQSDLIDLPENQSGRNVPDVSLNADPYTGYIYFFQGAVAAAGGTSFVAPQLNGITSVIGQAVGGRLGLLNPAMYRLARRSWSDSDSPFKDIAIKDNLGFQATPGYDPASGLGSIKATNLALALKTDSGN